MSASAATPFALGVGHNLEKNKKLKDKIYIVLILFFLFGCTTKSVEELDSEFQKGKYDLKRGKGGIMDIDFLTHYLQLLHGGEDKSLRTTSTRQALRRLSEAGKINKENSKLLLDAYDYLKSIESHLRVFDMRSISSFSKGPGKIEGLVRSMDYLDDDVQDTAKIFMDEYRNTTQRKPIKNCE